jgi:hypothetical protein
MARGRWIKPEFWSSEQISECSPNARLMFIGLWNFADDGGRHAASIKRLKMEVFPADSFNESKLRGWIDELKNAKDENGIGLITEYVVNGCAIWEVTGWNRHQKIEKPYFRHPDQSGIVPHSWNVRRTFGERSPQERNGNGTDSIDKEKKPFVGAVERTETERSEPAAEPGDYDASERAMRPVSWEEVYRDWFLPAGKAISKDTTKPPTAAMRETLMKAAYLAAAKYGMEWLIESCKVTRTEASSKPPNFLKGVLSRRSGVSISDLFDWIRVPAEYLKNPEPKG